MISIEFIKKTLAFQFNHDIDLGLFRQHQVEVNKFITGLFSYEHSVYSQVIPEFSFLAPPSEINLRLGIIKTNAAFDYRDLSFNEIIKYLEINDERFTHLVITDIFGRARQIAVNPKCKYSLFKEMYGSNPSIYISNLQQDLFANSRIQSLGIINNKGSYFNRDQLGFRLSNSCDHLFSSKRNLDQPNKQLNLAIVGGSFAASIYSLPGHSFSDYLERDLNSLNAFNKTIKIWNFSSQGAIQSVNFSHLINLGLTSKLDAVIWVDGLNDSRLTIPAKYLGLPDAPISFYREQAQSGINFPLSMSNKIKTSDRLNSYLSYRKMANTVFAGLGIKTVNILQPVCNMKSINNQEQTKMLFPFYSAAGKKLHSNYNPAVTYIKALGKTKYGLTFIDFPDSDFFFEFWDSCHLSPLGEYQFAQAILPSIKLLIGDLIRT